MESSAEIEKCVKEIVEEMLTKVSECDLGKISSSPDSATSIKEEFIVAEREHFNTIKKPFVSTIQPVNGIFQKEDMSKSSDLCLDGNSSFSTIEKITSPNELGYNRPRPMCNLMSREWAESKAKMHLLELSSFEKPTDGPEHHQQPINEELENVDQDKNFLQLSREINLIDNTPAFKAYCEEMKDNPEEENACNGEDGTQPFVTNTTESQCQDQKVPDNNLQHFDAENYGDDLSKIASHFQDSEMIAFYPGLLEEKNVHTLRKNLTPGPAGLFEVKESVSQPSNIECFTWTSAEKEVSVSKSPKKIFSATNDLPDEESFSSEKQVDIKTVGPCPLKLGLSRKQKVKPLHPYFKRNRTNDSTRD